MRTWEGRTMQFPCLLKCTERHRTCTALTPATLTKGEFFIVLGELKLRGSGKSGVIILLNFGDIVVLCWQKGKSSWFYFFLVCVCVLSSVMLLVIYEIVCLRWNKVVLLTLFPFSVYDLVCLCLFFTSAYTETQRNSHT